MNPEPVIVAFREVAETRHLLETLITSSESFDYFRAKAVLLQLREKVRVLAALQAELSSHASPSASGCIIPFPLPQRRPD